MLLTVTASSLVYSIMFTVQVAEKGVVAGGPLTSSRARLVVRSLRVHAFIPSSSYAGARLDRQGRAEAGTDRPTLRVLQCRSNYRLMAPIMRLDVFLDEAVPDFPFAQAVLRSLS